MKLQYDIFVIEKRLSASPQLIAEYVQLMKEYEDLKHMTRVESSYDEDEKDSYYLPHHET